MPPIPLITATLARDAQAVRTLLVQHHKDVDERDDEGRTALYVPRLQLLLDRSLSPLSGTRPPSRTTGTW